MNNTVDSLMDWIKKLFNDPVESDQCEIKTISSEEAKKQLDTDKDIILVDVRNEDEFNQKRIPGSVLMPLPVIKEEVQRKFTDKNAKIFVYCKSGRRSYAASQILTSLGYNNLFNIGGIDGWPYQVESGAPK